MRISLVISLIIAFFLSESDSYAQERRASITLDKSEIKIGEQIKARLELAFPVTENYLFFVPLDTLMKSVEIVSVGKIDTNYVGSSLETKVISAELILTSFDTGFHAIPPLVFKGSSDSLSTAPTLVTVTDVEVEMPDPAANQQAEIEIKDIKKIRDKQFSLWEWIKENYLTILIILLLAALVWAYFKYLHPKLKKRGIEILLPKNIVPPHDIALQKLKELDEKKLWQTGKVKLFHSELTEILRQYIEDQLKIPALESTSPEIVRDLKEASLEQSIIEATTALLELSDLVKFAKYLPLPDENDKSFRQVTDFIMSTKPSDQVEEKVEASHV